MTDEPYIVEIEDLDAFLEEQGRVTALRNSQLHDKQRGITWGSHFVRFNAVNRETVLSIFCRVETVDQFKSLEQAAGATERELAESVDNITTMHDDGYLFGCHYSTIEPTGEFGSTHRYYCWPIDEAIYTAASNAQWDVAAMTVIQRNRLQAIYHEFRAWAIEQQE